MRYRNVSQVATKSQDNKIKVVDEVNKILPRKKNSAKKLATY